MNAGLNEDSPSDATATLTGFFAASELRVGDVLGGRFRIDAMIGIGGMGVVYRAHDLSLDIDVALKLLRPDLARRPEAFGNFRQELLLARQVSSPHVVRIHDIAEHEGRWFISMDFIAGESLEHRLDRVRKLAPDAAVAIVRGLLEGLGAAHQRGVVHRDLKPANVLLGDGDHAYITDFGVARILGATGMTQTGMIVGTPEYLSPEQARGAPIDARSDLYAVGLIFYEMLAGELPFSGGTPAEAVVQRLLRPPPSLAKARPDLPGWLHAFSERLLKVNPAHRFASARDALRALEAKRVPRPPLDRRALLAGALALLACTAAGSWLWRHPWTTLAPPATVAPVVPRVAVLPLFAPTGDAELAAAARGLDEHLATWLRNDAGAASIPRRRVLDALARVAPDQPRDVLLRRLADVAGAANATRLVHGTLARDGQALRLQLWSGDPSSPLGEAVVDVHGANAAALFTAYRDATTKWLAASKLHAGAAPPLSADALVAYGGALAALDRHEPAPAATALAPLAAQDPASALVARALLDAQSEAQQELPAENTRAAVLQHFDHDDSALGRELRVRALDDAAKARALLDASLQAFPHDPPLALLDAETRVADGDGVGALAQLHRYVKEDDQDARAWFLLGRTSIQQGEAQPAVDEYLVHALVLDTRSRDAAAEAEVRNALGIGYERLGQLDAAAEQYTRAAATRERLGDTLGLSKTLRNLAIVQAERGEREAAERTLDRVKGMLERLGDRASLADLANDRGVIAEERGDDAAALAAYREALALRQQLDLPDQVAESLNNVGFSSFRLGQFDNALVYWQQAEALYRQLDDNNGLLRVEQSIGLLDIARGHFAAARERLQKTLRDAEDRQLGEEASAAHLDLGELALAEGRWADGLAHAQRAEQLAARRSDQRMQIEATLLQARLSSVLGDDAATDAALAKVPAEHANADQRAMRLLVAAAQLQSRGDFVAAAAKLDDAATAANEAHSGKVAVEIRLQRVRLAFATPGKPTRADASLAALRADAAQLAEVPTRLAWLELEIASALQAGDRTRAARRYREALPLLKDTGRAADAYFIHALGARAFAPDAAEATAATTAAAAARAELLGDAPEAARANLEQRLQRRLREEGGDAR
ncbi:tetratricopeptide (TPR) repeat protein [Dokdonella fugitiva]|uniref:non-specific serine/threonine protein kinase n=1 Tax=Dokdonella fugitiva TaxID=328517 RepID=A0A839F3F1_9GAMM|nr:serine/threonine-protein kinase [Dokdonella fugitiva]MBA8889116.1 tetratricopeptide (TPR) repeat protein [Dokdonella fugitiva]